MSQVEAIKALSEVLPNVPTARKEFAESLLGQYHAKGNLSSKQWYWVGKLYEMATGTEEKPEQIEVGSDFTGVVALFAKGAEKLKYPAIILKTPSGQEVILTRAGDNSKNPGYVYVKLEHVGYAGKVSKDGKFYPTDAVTEALKAEVVDLLTKLAADPAGTAAAYGKLTGCCCFCAKTLDNPKSLAVGYGPTCAKNYGLPYGVAAAEAASHVTMMPVCTEEVVAKLEAEQEEPQAPVQLPLNLDDLIAMKRGN